LDKNDGKRRRVYSMVESGQGPFDSARQQA
jgi:hypothetical protein